MLPEAEFEINLLRKAAASSYVIGVADLAILLLMLIVSVSELETQAGVYLRGVYAYVGLAMIILPISPYFIWYMYKSGQRLRLDSLRLIGVTWVIPVFWLLAGIPTVLKDLAAAEALMGRIAQGCVLCCFVESLSLALFTIWILVFGLFISFPVLVGAIELRHKTGLNIFPITIILALSSFIIEISTGLSIILVLGSPVMVILAVLFPLTILMLAIAMIAFGAGLGKLAGRKQERWTTSHRKASLTSNHLHIPTRKLQIRRR